MFSAFFVPFLLISSVLSLSPLITKQKILRDIKTSEKAFEAFKSDMKSLYGEENMAMFPRMYFPHRLKLVGKFLNAYLEQRTLKICITGTSVTAGHDNYFNESYPMVLQDSLRPVLTSSGVNLYVTNQAMGNNPTVPFDYCIRSVCGDADVITWEQWMMATSRSVYYIEATLRNAAALRSRPVFGVVAPNMKGRPSVSFAFTSTRDGSRVDELYADWGIHGLFLSKSLHVVNKSSPPFARFNDDKKIGHKSWHPGPHGHALIGHLMAYGYADIHIEALQKLKTQLSDNADALESLEALDESLRVPEYRHLPRSLPHSPVCMNNTYCEIGYAECTQSYAPIENSAMDITRFVISNNLVDFRPNIGVPIEAVNSTVVEDSVDNWDVILYQNSYNPVAHAEEMNARYKDYKWIVTGRKSAGVIAFRFVSKVKGKVMICVPRGFSKKDGNAGILNENEVRCVIDSTRLILLKKSDMCAESATEIDSGVHILEIEVLIEGIELAINHILWQGGLLQ